MKRCCAVLCVALGVSAALAAPAFALVSDGAHGWFWQMPQPAGVLNDVTFTPSGELFAVGDGGLIEHSADGGATWAAQPTGTDADLWSVSFTDDTHGWACGGRVSAAAPGVILATTDGGAWVDKTPSGLTESLTDVSFVSATHGWIGTDDGHILSTTDGGGAWQTLKLGAYNDVVTVDFVDATHGWAGGAQGRIWHTVDGGASWSDQASGLTPDMQLSQLDFADRTHGWALAESQSSGLSAVLVTSDGGRHWRPASHTDPAASGLCVTGPSSAWLVATETGGSQPAAGLGALVPQYGGLAGIVLQHTTDGGAHWQRSSLGSPVGVGAVASHGADVCAVGQAILISPDGGATWRSASSGQQYAFTAADAISATDIWAVDAWGAVLHSTDGRRWVEQTEPSSAAQRWVNSLTGVSFADPADGWVVGSDTNGDGVILHTTDGGASWAPQASLLSGALAGVQFIDSADGWAISDSPGSGASGSNDPIERTIDGGKTWIPDYVASGAALTAVDFVGDTTGWATGSYQSSSQGAPLPAVFATTDGGVTWARQTLPALPGKQWQLTSLQFTDADNGWATGAGFTLDASVEYPFLLHTTDGGSHWALLAGGLQSGAGVVYFSDPTHGWLGGDDGVAATTDGGATWQRVAAGMGIRAIAAADPQHVWAFGYASLVSTLDASGDTAAPLTLVDRFDSAWHRRPVTIHLSAGDVGGSQVSATQHSLDSRPWQDGGAVVVDAPPDHADDGLHTILYRSLDAAGNQEQTENLTVGIDTLGPACSAPRESAADTGKSAILRFMANDATSGVASATISIVNAHGHVLRRFVEHLKGWSADPPPSYFWLRFTCTLKPGVYQVVVRATDAAGNAQVTIGRNALRVVRRGAAAPRPPSWPAGLPGQSQGFAGRQTHLPGARGLASREALPAVWSRRLR